MMLISCKVLAISKECIVKEQELEGLESLEVIRKRRSRKLLYYL
jgi:hypothetical protein